MSQSSAISSRYSRAASFFGPELASRFPNLWIEGRWIDGQRLFYIEDVVDASGRVINHRPTLLDFATGQSLPVLSDAVLSQMLEVASCPVEHLVSADFDMPDAETLAIHLPWLSILVDVAAKKVKDARPTGAEPRLWSPDSLFAVFLRGHDLWLHCQYDGIDRPLTSDGVTNFSCARHPDSAGFPISNRAAPHPTGLWSPTSRWFVTHCIDERAVSDGCIIQHAPESGGRPILHSFKYPLPGEAVALGALIAFDIQSGQRIALTDSDFSVPGSSPFAHGRVWFCSEHTFCFLRFDRYEKTVELLQFDLISLGSRKIYSESVADGNIELNPGRFDRPNVRMISQSNEFVWFSERDGWGHLYLHDATTGALKNRITKGAYQVVDIIHLDEQKREILFVAAALEAQADRSRRTLCSISLDGGDLKIVCGIDGDVAITPSILPVEVVDRPWRTLRSPFAISADGSQIVVRRGTHLQGSRTEIIQIPSRVTISISCQRAPSPAPRVLPFSAKAADGETDLSGLLFLPFNFDETLDYPLVDYCYPGPHVALVCQTIPALKNSHALSLSELGIITMVLDSRGTPFGDRDFRQASYGKLLEPQIADHSSVIDQLAKRHSFIDRSRIGIFGQSAGGAAAAQALFRHGNLFRSAVAVAGCFYPAQYVSDWADKYLGPSAETLEIVQPELCDGGRALLIIAGDFDDNVHLAQSLKLSRDLIAYSADFEFAIIPNGGHDILNSDFDTVRRVWDHFVRTLVGEDPPKCFQIDIQPDARAHFQRARRIEARL